MRPSDLTLDNLLQADPDALYDQALRWRHADGVAEDLKSARRLFGFVALHGHSAARYQAGLMNQRGEGGEKNLVRALMWFRLAAGRDEPRAAAQIRRLSEDLKPIEVRQSHALVAEAEKARSNFVTARKTGDAHAMASLGMQLFTGKGVEPDAALAVAWLQRAASLNDADAQMFLAMAYANGTGIPKNLPEAQRLFQMAADQGHREAQYQWAQFLEQHSRQAASHAKAIQLYEAAADQGHLPAQLRLGQLFKQDEVFSMPVMAEGTADGEAAPVAKKPVHKRSHAPHLVRALDYFTMAAEQGHRDAQFELGQMYAQGLGTPQKFEDAIHWFQQAARQGHAKAQFNLAFQYAHGQGVEVDYLKAYEWYRISHLCGYPLAKAPMEFTAKKLSSGQVEMADWRADSFIHQLEDHSHS